MLRGWRRLRRRKGARLVSWFWHGFWRKVMVSSVVAKLGCCVLIIVIEGTKHIKYLKENAGAVNIVLSKEDDEKIRKTIESVGGSSGARYPEAIMSSCFGDTPELGSD